MLLGAQEQKHFGPVSRFQGQQYAQMMAVRDNIKVRQACESDETARQTALTRHRHPLHLLMERVNKCLKKNPTSFCNLSALELSVAAKSCHQFRRRLAFPRNARKTRNAIWVDGIGEIRYLKVDCFFFSLSEPSSLFNSDWNCENVEPHESIIIRRAT